MVFSKQSALKFHILLFLLFSQGDNNFPVLEKGTGKYLAVVTNIHSRPLENVII